MIKSVEISGLFGNKNVKLSLADKVNIFVGENGLGKTTILNIINGVLTLDFFALEKLPFKKVLIKTDENTQRTIDKAIISEIVNSACERRPYLGDLERVRARRLAELKNNLNYENIAKIVEFQKKFNTWGGDTRLTRVSNAYRELRSEYGSVVAELYGVFIENGTLKKLVEIYNFAATLHDSIIYFPTYRRIEADLQNFDISEEQIKNITKNSLINFGMNDVESALREKLDTIGNGIKLGFHKMALTLLDSYTFKKSMDLSSVNLDRLNFIFGVLSNEINNDLKTEIINIVSNESLYTKNDTLINFLNELLKIYESQEKNIESIDRFVEICNDYFGMKKLVFDREYLRVDIIEQESLHDDSACRKLSFASLSSGEKQIVSLFSKLYLTEGNEYLILFDEPELSLSIDWQRKLIPDIMRSQKCAKLIAVTHSPFIFDNDYKKNARALSDSFN